MQILKINRFNLTNHRQVNQIATQKQNAPSFGSAEIYNEVDSGSILDLMDRRAKQFDIGDVSIYADYWEKQRLTGYPVSDPDLAKLEISSFRSLGNNNYKGGMLSARNNIDALTAKGIRKFILLCDDSECGIIDELTKRGIPYNKLYVPVHSELPETMKDEVILNVKMNRFVEAFEDLRKGNVFIGCESGSWRTRRALSALKRLDPQSPLPDELLTGKNRGNIQYTEWIHKLMDSSLKQKLGYSESFEAGLKNLFASIHR